MNLKKLFKIEDRMKKYQKPAIIAMLSLCFLVFSFLAYYKYSQASYSVVSFTQVGSHSWTVPEGVTKVEVLVVAGGGGGGLLHGAGGGAGGLVYQENYSVTPGQTINIAVGNGGDGSTGGAKASNGENSIFGGLTAIGGGAGGQYGVSSHRNGSSGGSGGGSTSLVNAPGTSGQGNNGGTGATSGSPYNWGGGGGAGEAGGNATSSRHGGGGNGLYYGDKFGDSYGENGWFAGGGGGGGHNPAPPERGLGGNGGGGNGGTPGVYEDGESGLSGTGGGGGGASTPGGGSNIGGNGGSGIVLIRYVDRRASAGMAINKGLVAHYRMDQVDYNPSSSRLSDKSAYSNHGTNYGATFTEDRFEKEGGAINFGRSGSNLSIESPVGKPAYMTASVWYKRDDSISSGTWRTILGHKTSNIHHLISQSGSKTLGIFDGGFRAFQHTPQNNEWEHYVVIYNSGVDASLYVNGQFNSKVSTSLNLLTNPIGMIGNWKGGNYWSGAIDDVRIYDRALSESEIKSLYDSYSPKTTAGSLQKGLILDMPLKLKYTKSETPGSQVMTDRTPYSNDGQNSGATITNDGASFSGTNSSNITSSNDLLLNSSQTYSGWVRVSSVSGGLKGVLTTHNYRTPSNLGINIINDKFYISIGYTDGSREYGSKGSSYRVDLNEWIHVILLYNKIENSVSFYINGDFDNKWFLSKEVNFVPDKLLIGLWSNNYSGYRYNGEISNVLLYNRALSEEEIKILYNRGRSDAGIIFQEN